MLFFEKFIIISEVNTIPFTSTEWRIVLRYWTDLNHF